MKPRDIFKYLRLAEKPKSTEEQIEDLVNRLILKLKADGKSIRSTTVEGIGHLAIWVFRLEEDGAYISIEAGDWKMKVKPHFNKF